MVPAAAVSVVLMVALAINPVSHQVVGPAYWCYLHVIHPHVDTRLMWGGVCVAAMTS